MIEKLDFTPFPGLSTPKMQMLFSYFIIPTGKAAPSTPKIITLYDGDQLICQVSTPKSWTSDQKTIVMLHGLGGSQDSPYLVRLSRKFYRLGYRVVRVNLRGSGPGRDLSRLPYNGANSLDIATVLRNLKAEDPSSPIALIGFSFGANIALKLAGELGSSAHNIVEQVIAICPPLDFGTSISLLSLDANKIYHQYFLDSIVSHGNKWFKGKHFQSIYEIDSQITAPLWGYKSAIDYYHVCSCKRYLSGIRVPTKILFSADDPFIDYRPIDEISLHPSTKIYITDKGGHMGFFSKPKKDLDCFWMDQLLISWIHEAR